LERSCFFKTNNPSKGKFWKESKSSIKVNQFTKLWELIKTWDSMADIQRKLGIEQSNITKCCRWRTRSLGGFIWKYV
jgi:hypothetical protein